MDPIDIIHAWRNKVILVVGDVCVDRWLTCRRSDRPNPEADGGILEVLSVTESIGMAGLVAEMVKALGGSSILRCGVGPRPQKERFLCDGEILPRIDYDRRLSPVSLDAESPKVNCVLVCDYGKGSVDRQTILDALQLARRDDCLLIGDPARNQSWETYRGVDCIKANAQEADGQETESTLIVTQGSGGCTITENDRAVWIETEPIEMANVVGAGDQFLSALGLARAAGATWQEACELANLAAWIKVQKPRTEPATYEELIRELQRDKCQDTHTRFASTDPS